MNTEAILIGAAFNDPTLTLTLDVSSEDFSSELNVRLWCLISEAAKLGKRVTLKQLGETSPEVAKYVQSIAALAPSGELQSYVSALKDEAARNRLRKVAEQLAFDADNVELNPDDIATQTIGSLASVLRSQAKTNKQVGQKIIEDQSKPLQVYPTGLGLFDDAIGGGLLPGKLYAIAARKKVGKTAFLGTISHNLNFARVKHLFIALEMSPEEIEQRKISHELGINSIGFLKRKLNGDLQRAADYVVSAPEFTVYEHSPGATIDEVRRMVARAVLHHGIKGVILDYWQLVTGIQKGQNEEYHLRMVAQWLADFCRRENLWAMVAVQLNQEGNSRGGEGIKLACDMYLALHREKQSEGAWIEMEESRFVPYSHVGSETNPGLWFRKNGPHFEDASAFPTERIFPNDQI